MTAPTLPGFTPIVPHPAPYSHNLLPVFAGYLDGRHAVVDPMAGEGRVHIPARWAGVPVSVGVELEPEWAAAHPRTICGNALALPFGGDTFDAICVSPAYGNRFANDTSGCTDPRGRKDYRRALGRPLSDDSGAALLWGDEYRDLHARAWAEVNRVLAPGGVWLLNCKDHNRAKQRQRVTDFHARTLEDLGLTITDRIEVQCPGYGFGSNLDANYPEEIIVAAKPLTY